MASADFRSYVSNPKDSKRSASERSVLVGLPQNYPSSYSYKVLSTGERSIGRDPYRTPLEIPTTPAGQQSIIRCKWLWLRSTMCSTNRTPVRNGFAYWVYWKQGKQNDDRNQRLICIATERVLTRIEKHSGFLKLIPQPICQFTFNSYLLPKWLQNNHASRELSCTTGTYA